MAMRAMRRVPPMEIPTIVVMDHTPFPELVSGVEMVVAFEPLVLVADEGVAPPVM
jgi:hypothetical protein